METKEITISFSEDELEGVMQAVQEFTKAELLSFDGDVSGFYNEYARELDLLDTFCNRFGYVLDTFCNGVEGLEEPKDFRYAYDYARFIIENKKK